ncbi:MAG: MATE family efflux transporter [Oscillospiraceae bacterium]|nr:MATE family efflux transporter [Oscillospiraceae bacterium]
MSQDSKKAELFERTPIPKAILTMAVPTVLSSLVMVIYNLADTYFVGYLNDPIQNAAVTLAAPVLLAFNAVNNLFGVGAGSAMSRGLGRKDYDDVRRSSSFGFYAALFCAAMFSLLCTVLRTPLLNILGAENSTIDATRSYLFYTTTCGAIPAILNVVMANFVRAEGSTLHASIGTMSGCLLNIILDPIFILPFGLGMGAAGAGLATFISNCFACLYFFVLLFVRRGKTYVCISPKMAKPTGAIAREVFTVGIPAGIQNLLNVTGMTVLNNFTAAFGTEPVAAMGIAYKINMIPMYIGMGISQGIMPLVGYTFASKNIKRMKECIYFTAKITLAILFTMAVLCFAFAPGLIRLFINSDSVIDYGTRFLRGMCLGIPFLGFDFLGVGVYQACGKGHISLSFALARKVALEIPALFILNAVYPLYGLAYAQPITEFILAIAAAIVLRKLIKKSGIVGADIIRPLFNPQGFGRIISAPTFFYLFHYF